MAQQAVQPFSFNGHTVSAIEKDGEVWWAGKDVAEILGYDKPENAYRLLKDDEKDTHKVSGTPQGGNPNQLIVNEPGLYRLIFNSRKPEAEAFRKWVFHEVLPAIRRTGQYVAPALKANERVVNRFGLLVDFEIVEGFIEALYPFHKAAPEPIRNAFRQQYLRLKWKVTGVNRLGNPYCDGQEVQA